MFAALGENFLRLGVHRQRARGEEEAGAVEQFDQRLGALLQAGHGLLQLREQCGVELGGKFFAAGEIGEGVDQRLRQLHIGRRAHIMAVHILELHEIEARR